ncbi:MAG: hypothetical protein GXO83_05365 [Chlorobi bacterium]|nr:hypothetical protein [Chlorobiota bacterium]
MTILRSSRYDGFAITRRPDTRTLSVPRSGMYRSVAGTKPARRSKAQVGHLPGLNTVF